MERKINIKDAETLKCESCGSIYFEEVFYLKRVSKIMTATDQDTTVPFPIYRCADCKHVNNGFNPFEEQSISNDK